MKKTPKKTYKDWLHVYEYGSKLWNLGLIDGYTWGQMTYKAMGFTNVSDKSMKFAKHVGSPMLNKYE